MNALRGWHILVLAAVIILLFGAKRLPDAARSLGRSLRIIKAETRSLADDDRDLAEKADAQAARQPLHPDPGYPNGVHQPGYQPSAPPAADPVQRVRDN